MQPPQDRGTAAPGESVGLVRALRSLAANAAEYLQARAALLRAEGREASRNWGIGAGLIVGGALLLIAGYFLTIAGAVAALTHLTGWFWGWILLGAGLLHLAGAAAAVFAAMRFFTAPAFRITRNELMKDQQWLQRTANRP